MKFDCPRTCPMYGPDLCRFNPVLSQLGTGVVTSHTVKVKTSMLADASFEAAVKCLGGTIVGLGSHRIFEYGTEATGLAFRLPNWRQLLVLQADGSLAYDDYNGAWGNADELDRLRAEYTLCKAMNAAMDQGWQCERVGDTLTVYHPSGGTLTVSGTDAAASGFHGVGCHDALMALGVSGEYTPTEAFGETECSTDLG